MHQLLCRSMLWFIVMTIPVGAYADFGVWHGKYPHEIVNDKTVWQDPVVKKLTAAVFSRKAKDRVFKRHLTTVVPMHHEHGFLTIFGCLPDNCYNGRYMVLIHEPSQKIWSLVTYVSTRNGEMVAVRCYSTEDNLGGLSSHLLDSFKQAFPSVVIANFMQGDVCPP